MADPHIRAAFYLSPTLDALWRWSEDGEALTWPDDTTIAFRAEVEAVLKRLAPGGLPRFGAVALLLAACRNGWPASHGRETVAGYARVFSGMNSTGAQGGPLKGAQAVFGRVVREINRLLEGLDAVNRLPQELREGLAAKALLADVVFEAAANRSSPDDAAAIVQAIEEGIDPETLRPQLCHEESLSQFAREVDGLHVGLARVDAEMLAQRLKTGIDQPIQSPDEDLSPPLRVRRLLAALSADTELAPLAKLAHDLMAAVSIPRSLRLKDDLPAGGVSDLSNRGPLDRLLVSELAHDELTLAIRVAVNEALYLRPESPPREPPHRRAILLDSGIRMWGVPRLFATAAALALAATNDPHAQLCIFRAAGANVDSVNLTSRKGLDAHLGALETAPHPGESLPAFIQGATDESDEQVDLVVITHADVLADSDFLTAVRAARAASLYVATVDREGAFCLWALSAAGKKPIRQARLSLDAILGRSAPAKQKSPGVPLIVDRANPDLPAIFRRQPFPLDLPYRVNHRKAAVSEKYGLVAATSDGRLLHWRDAKHGGRLLTALLPRGFVQLISIDDANAVARVVVTRGQQKTAQLIHADLRTGQCTSISLELRDPNPWRIYMWAGILYITYREHVDAYELREGRQIASANLPRRRSSVHGRFFKSGGAFKAIAYDATNELKLQTVPAHSEAMVVFDREGSDGPCAVLHSGRIVGSTGKDLDTRIPAVGRRTLLLGISPDGHRLAFKLASGNHVFDIQRHKVWQGGAAYGQELLGPQMNWSIRGHVTPRKAFFGIFVDSNSNICLLSPRRKRVLALNFHPTRGWDLVDQGDADAVWSEGRALTSRVRQFTRKACPTGGQFSLDVATWDDGSKAFLDPRGMLHLKSADRSIPELSLTLTNIPVAAWSSEGKVCGPSYFIGDAKVTDPAYFEGVIERFVARLR